MSGEKHERDHTITRLMGEGMSAGWKICKDVYRSVHRAIAAEAAMMPRVPPPAPDATFPRETTRQEDRLLGPPPGSEALGTVLVVCAFAVAIAAGAGFVFVYWVGGSNVALGGTLALSFGGFGAALVLWAHWLMPHREAIEPREPAASPEPDREALLRDFSTGENGIQRRKLLQGLVALVLTTFAAIIVSLLRSLAQPPGPPLLGAVWKRGDRLITLKGTAASVNTLQPGDFVTVFPEGSVGDVHAQTILLRVEVQNLRLPRQRSSWAPMGYLAYSRVCTHAGCPVGEFEPATDLLLCPCHQSTFNVLTGAQPTGGPAARALPQLPLYADPDGTLRAAGDFSHPPGPGFWRIPS